MISRMRRGKSEGITIRGLENYLGFLNRHVALCVSVSLDVHMYREDNFKRVI